MKKNVLVVQSPYNHLTTTLNFSDIFKYAKNNNYEQILVIEQNSLNGLYEATRLSKQYNINVVYSLQITKNNLLNNVIIIPRTTNGIEIMIKVSTDIMAEKKYDLELLTNNYQDLYLFSLDSIDNLKTFIYSLEPIANKHWFPIIRSNNDNEATFIKSYNQSLTNHLIYTLTNINNDIQENQLVYNETINLINKINTEYSLPEFKMAKYQNNKGLSSDKFLQELSHLGLLRRLDNKTNKIYEDRLKYELSVISSMNFADYFLIVYDIVRWARTNDILVGPARGSSAGSLIAYTLGITDIDPIKFDLLFERFLNPSRYQMPDIDLDFPDNKRNLVVDYIISKYGEDFSYSLSVYSLYGFNKALSDYLKTLNVDERRRKGIANSINNNILDKSDNQAYQAYLAANSFKDTIDQIKTHPAGIVITNESLYGLVPLRKGSLKLKQISYDYNASESLGLVKIDLLAIKTLSIIEEIFTLLNAKFSWNKIPLNNQATYELLSSGNTDYIFQLESFGMKNTLRKLKPVNFDELSAVLALYRPGPMSNIDQYIKNKNNINNIKYLHKDLEPILKSTYGIIIYQEQIIQILTKIGKLTLGESDLVRRSITKKDQSLIATYKKEFITGALSSGYRRDEAIQLFSYVEKFANYGFNKSHSISYSHITYLVAYLKTNNLNYFMAVMLKYNLSNKKEVLKIINELNKNKINLLKPNINQSTEDFTVTNKGILSSLLTIKLITVNIANKIIELRDQKPFTTFEDFKQRTKDFITRDGLINLIYSGALDSLSHNRKTMIELLDIDLTSFGNSIDDLYIPKFEEFPKNILEAKQREVLGFTIK